MWQPAKRQGVGPTCRNVETSSGRRLHRPKRRTTSREWSTRSKMYDWEWLSSTFVWKRTPRRRPSELARWNTAARCWLKKKWASKETLQKWLTSLLDKHDNLVVFNYFNMHTRLILLLALVAGVLSSECLQSHCSAEVSACHRDSTWWNTIWILVDKLWRAAQTTS